MNKEPELYTVEELAEATGVAVRTIRYYVAEGLLPPPVARGRFSTNHLARLRVIRRLTAEFVRLDKIRERMAELSDEEVAALTEESAMLPEVVENIPSQNQGGHQKDSARDYIKRVLAGHSVPLPASTPRPGVGPPNWPASPPKAYSSHMWQHFEIAPGVTLQVRQPVDAETQKFVDRLLAHADALRGPRR